MLSGSDVCLRRNQAMDPWVMAIPSPLFILSVERGEKFTSAGGHQRDTGSYSPPSRGRCADTGASRARERISLARSR